MLGKQKKILYFIYLFIYLFVLVLKIGIILIKLLMEILKVFFVEISFFDFNKQVLTYLYSTSITTTYLAKLFFEWT